MTKWIIIFFGIPLFSLVFMRHQANEPDPVHLTPQDLPHLDTWIVMAYVHAEDSTGTIPLHFTLVSHNQIHSDKRPTEQQMEKIMTPQVTELKENISFMVTGVYYYAMKGTLDSD